MTASEKLKLSPRDTFIIVQDVVEKNGDFWAEIYKLGDKISNKPQLVKVQDLIPLPATRSAKSKAKEALKNLAPLLKLMAHSLGPTYSWDYERWLQAIEDEDNSDQESEFDTEEDAKFPEAAGEQEKKSQTKPSCKD